MASPKATSLLGVIEKPAAVHTLRAKASLAVGRHAEALDAVRCARKTRSGAEPVSLALEELDALFGLLRHAEAVAVATRALHRRPTDADVEARLRVARGYALWSLGRISAGVAETRKALGLATTDLTLARARETLGLFAWKEQELEAASVHLAGARLLYTKAASRDGLVRTLEREGAVLRDADKLKEALRVQTLRVEMASTTTRFDAAARALSDRGSLLVVMGRWAEAREDLDRACDLFARVSDPREHTLAGVSRAALDLATGNPGAARAALARARGVVDAAQGRDPRSQAEILLGLADVELAEGDAQGAERSLGEGLALFDLVQDRVGQCRARFRRSHALLSMDRTAEAVREARRALRLASWPARTDLRGAAELALGRALLHARRADAGEAFDRSLALSAARPVVAQLARFGGTLARGAGREDPATREALAAVEAWGDRRLLAYCLADLDRLRGPAPASAGLRARRDPRAGDGTCAAARVIVDAAVGFAGEGDWSARWSAAVRALRPLLPWHRIAYVAADTGWELRADWKEAACLAPTDLARTLTTRMGGPAWFDLTGEPWLRTHPVRLLHGVRWALVAPAGPRAALYADLRESDPPPGGREAEVLGQLGRLLEHDPPAPTGGAPDPARAFPEIVGACPAMEALFRQMERLAGSQIAVQILGETGTGKEKFAQALHRRSPRRERPFVAINASSLSDELFEAEMFGHTRGAFTGAVAERTGHVAEAEGGTLFIDEVADLTPRAQAKLLRLVQEKEYRRLGETRTRRADVRILTASNVALEVRVALGLFREDLVYRLSAVVLALPPLRERGQDLLHLARHFLRRAAEQEGRPAPALTAELAAVLSRFSWPGNVRELENEMHRLVALAGAGPLRPEHLSEKLRRRSGPSGVALRGAVKAFEKEHLTRVLEQHAGNRAHAAGALGITRQALVAKIRRLGIS